MRFGIQMMAADAGMDTTCPSPEIPNDSRKRPLDAESDNGSTKRSHFSGESQAKHTKKNLLLMLKKIRKKRKIYDVVLHVHRARKSRRKINKDV
jgi:hypothetical protein